MSTGISDLMADYAEKDAHIEELMERVADAKEAKRQVALRIHEHTKGDTFKHEDKVYRTVNKSDGQCFVRSATEKKSA